MNKLSEEQKQQLLHLMQEDAGLSWTAWALWATAFFGESIFPEECSELFFSSMQLNQ